MCCMFRGLSPVQEEVLGNSLGACGVLGEEDLGVLGLLLTLAEPDGRLGSIGLGV